MADLYSDHFGGTVALARHMARARRARLMVMVAGLCAFGLVAVAAALLIHLI